jgi:hypothetical protein
MSTPEENIKTILADWLDALRRHDFVTVERRMDPEVFWQGVREDFICRRLHAEARGDIWAKSAATIPIPGFRTVAQVEENAGAMTREECRDVRPE